MSDFHDDETSGPMRTVPAATRLRDGGPIAAVVAIVVVVVVVAALVGSAMLSPTGVTPTLEVATALRPAAARLATAPTSAPASPAPAQTSLRTPRAAAVQFEPNLGQSPADARYVAHGPGFTAEVLADGVRMHQSRRPAARHGQPTAGADMVASARLRFVGADTTNALDAREPGTAVSSYLIGSDASRWLHDVPGYRQLRQPQIYPGVDLVYYGRDGEFEYDLVVQPKADASRIRLAIDGSRKPSIDAGGDLLLDGPGGALRMHRPVLYQHIDGVRKTLQGDYVMLASNEVGFRLPAYDHARPLIIDPTFKLLYSTYLGGVHDDQVGGMVLDAQSNAYIVGTSASEDWPVSGNAYQAKRKNIGTYVRNVVVTKFDASGNLVYSTFIGGSTNDYGNGIALDAAGNAYITGSTTSADFPVTANAIQSTPQGSGSAFLAVLSSDGSALSYSTLFGSSSAGRSVAFDAAGTLWLGGYAGPGLTTTANAYKTTLATGTGAFVAKFTLPPAGPAQLLASTYYGTDTPQTNYQATGVYLQAMALDPAGTPWFAAQAYTTNLPQTSGALSTPPSTMDAGCDYGPTPLNSFGFVGNFSADLSTLTYASYLTGKTRVPGDCAEYAYSVAFDPTGNVYIGGVTASDVFPTTVGAAQTIYPGNSGYYGFVSFVTKLRADGSAILWSSYLGGTTGDSFLSNVVADSTGSPWAFIATSGGSNYPVTSDAFQPAHGGGSYDASLVHLDAGNGALVYATYFGGSGSDGSSALALDASGNVYLAGTTGSTDLPVTSTAVQPNLTANAYDGSDWFFTILGTGAVSRVLPSASGNGGDVTLSAFGVGLQPGATASLVSGATTVASRTGYLATDGASESFGFSLDGVAAGSYDLVIANPDGTVITRKAAFTVAAAGAPALSAQVLGRPKFRTGVPTTFQVVVSNTGTQEAIMVPLWISVPASASLAIDGFSVADTAAMLSVSDASKTYVNRFIGKLSPGESTTVSVHITTTADADFVAVSAALQAPWFRTADQFNGALTSDTYDSDCVPDSANPAYSNCLGPYEDFAILGTRAFASASVISPADARIAAQRVRALGDPCKALDHATEERDKGIADGKEDLRNGKGPDADGSAFKRDVPNPAKDPIGWINYNAGYVNGQFTVITGASSSARRPGVLSTTIRALDGEACPIHPPTPPPTIQPPGSGGGGSGGSIDPNDKTGPSGDGSASHFIRADAPLAYQVEFENQPSASLPAANVVVTDQLDPTKVDLSTFTLGAITFGSTTIAVPAGLASYQTTVALSSTLSVRVQGSLDATTGLAKWTFTTIDPATKLPPSDPTVGFLPPDADGMQGQGSVSFTVHQKSGAATGTTYSNMANVVFDANAAIVTPTWVNTVDTTLPASKVQSAVGEAGTTGFDVDWSGTDTGSGVASYTVYVSDSGAAYTVWQPSTTGTTAAYTGVSGHSYAFYVIATDGAGNVEPAKSAAEATITVNGNFSAATSGSDSGGGGCSIGGDGRSDPTLPLAVILAAGVLGLLRRRAGTQRRGER